MSLVEFVVNKLEDLKATDILPLNVKGKSSITDTMILCTGTSSRHVSSLAQKLITECKLAGIDVFGDEGKETADGKECLCHQPFLCRLLADGKESLPSAA